MTIPKNNEMQQWQERGVNGSKLVSFVLSKSPVPRPPAATVIMACWAIPARCLMHLPVLDNLPKGVFEESRTFRRDSGRSGVRRCVDRSIRKSRDGVIHFPLGSGFHLLHAASTGT
jgi:hypothetical protein